MLKNIGSERPAVSDWASALSWGHDEANLVHELQTGSETAFDWLVTHYHAPVYNLILGMLGDTSDAADGTQEVFLKAFRGIRNFRQGSSLKTWLYRIAIREALNHKRWFKRHLQKNVSIDAEPEEGHAHIEIEDHGVTPFDQLAAMEIQVAVRGALQQVPDVFRSAVILEPLLGTGELHRGHARTNTHGAIAEPQPSPFSDAFTAARQAAVFSQRSAVSR